MCTLVPKGRSNFKGYLPILLTSWSSICLHTAGPSQTDTRAAPSWTSWSVTLRSKSQTEFHPIETRSSSYYPPSQPLYHSPVWEASFFFRWATPRITFPFSDYQPWSNKDETMLLDHSPHEVKVTHLHTGWYFFPTATTGKLKTMADWARRQPKQRRHKDTEGKWRKCPD